MNAAVLEKMFEHNHWANLQIIEACVALTDAQLDAEPPSATKGSRHTLLPLVGAQEEYLSLLALPIAERSSARDMRRRGNLRVAAGTDWFVNDRLQPERGHDHRARRRRTDRVPAEYRQSRPPRASAQRLHTL
jgi:hypothetical protein